MSPNLVILAGISSYRVYLDTITAQLNLLGVNNYVLIDCVNNESGVLVADEDKYDILVNFLPKHLPEGGVIFSLLSSEGLGKVLIKFYNRYIDQYVTYKNLTDRYRFFSMEYTDFYNSDTKYMEGNIGLTPFIRSIDNAVSNSFKIKTMELFGSDVDDLSMNAHSISMISVLQAFLKDLQLIENRVVLKLDKIYTENISNGIVTNGRVDYSNSITRSYILGKFNEKGFLQYVTLVSVLYVSTAYMNPNNENEICDWSQNGTISKETLYILYLVSSSEIFSNGALYEAVNTAFKGFNRKKSFYLNYRFFTVYDDSEIEAKLNTIMEEINEIGELIMVIGGWR